MFEYSQGVIVSTCVYVCVRYACQNFDRVDNAYVLPAKLRLAFGECVSMCIVKKKRKKRKSDRLIRMAGNVRC